MKNKNLYFAPTAEFVAVASEKDILVTSAEVDASRDDYSEDFGVIFPF